MTRAGLFEGIRKDNKKKVIGCYVFGLEDKVETRTINNTEVNATFKVETHVIVNQNEKNKKDGQFTSYPVFPDSVKAIKTPELLRNEAIHQFLGFAVGKRGYDITELASGMNLEFEEWQIIREETCDLDDDMKKEIDDWFKEKGE